MSGDRASDGSSRMPGQRAFPDGVILNGLLGHRLEYNDAATRDLR